MTQPDDNYPPQVQKARRQIENGMGSLLDEFERQRLAAERAQGRAREARALSKALAAELGAPFVLRIADAELLQHLAAQHAQAVLDAVGSEIVTAGFGPWGEQVLDDTLAAVGFTPQFLDEQAGDFEIFVVGSKGVDVDELAIPIYRRLEQGRPVRLYSQELWLLYLMTGSDPLQWSPELLQRCFGTGHPVLQAFVNEDWDWPEWIEVSVGGGEGGDDHDGAEFESGPSPLHTFGYRAGVGHGTASRRERLRAFLECRTIADYCDADHHDSAYRESWGRPLSARRLRRMVSHLRWLLRFQGADARKAEAREHWRQDLAWMRTVLGPVVTGPGL